MGKLPWVLNAVLLMASCLQGASIRTSSEERLVQHFGQEASYEFSYFLIPADLKTKIEQTTRQHFFKDKVYYWKVTRRDSTVGFAILDNVMGKAMPITFLVIFDDQGRVLSSDIIKYREAIGGEVSNPRWLKQFSNMEQKDFLDPHLRVDGISGATISVNSVSKGIMKLGLLFPEIKDLAMTQTK